MKASSLPTSIGLNPRELLECSIRKPKYLRTVHITPDSEEVPLSTITRFFRSLRTAKTLRKLSLNAEVLNDTHIRLKDVPLLIKRHSQSLKNVDLPMIPCQITNSPLKSLKKLQGLNTSNKKIDHRTLQALNNLTSLVIDVRYQITQANRLFYAMSKLSKLKKLSLLCSPALLKKVLDLLNFFSSRAYALPKIQISTVTDGHYSQLPNLDDFVARSVSKLSLQHIATPTLLDNIFTTTRCLFPNLQGLKLNINSSNLKFASSLKYLENLLLLKRLSLSFEECGTKEFSRQIIADLQLPSSLRKFTINMPLSIQDLIQNAISLGESDIFEQEPLFKSFFERLGHVKNLENLELNFQLLERFRSYHTDFFISILKRFPHLRAFAAQAIDYKRPEATDKLPECFDLAKFLNSCSTIKTLENIEIAMPNLSFEKIKLCPRLMNLKGFNIGISGLEEGSCFQFQNISKNIQRVLETLALNAPELKSLILDFGEFIDEKSFCKRFAVLEKFQKLELLYLKFFLGTHHEESIKSAGRSLQSMKRLNTLVLRFFETDIKVLEIKKYLRYHKSLQDTILSCDKTTWMGADYGGSLRSGGQLDTMTDRNEEDEGFSDGEDIFN